MAKARRCRCTVYHVQCCIKACTLGTAARGLWGRGGVTSRRTYKTNLLCDDLSECFVSAVYEEVRPELSAPHCVGNARPRLGAVGGVPKQDLIRTIFLIHLLQLLTAWYFSPNVHKHKRLFSAPVVILALDIIIYLYSKPTLLSKALKVMSISSRYLFLAPNLGWKL